MSAISVKMKSICLCHWIFRQAVVAGLFFSGASPVLAGLNIQADLEGTRFQRNGRQSVQVNHAGHGRIKVYANELNWDVTNSHNSSQIASGSSFSSFCVDLTQFARNATHYDVQDVAAGQLADGASIHGGRQLVAFGSLFYNFYDRITNGSTAAAFQLAVWEIVYNTSGSPSSYDVGSGNFQATNRASIRQQANNWLADLTNDGVSLRVYTTDSGQSQIGLSPPNVGNGMSAVPEPFSAVIWSVLGCVAYGAGLRRRRSLKPRLV